ncbi:MAG TPA: helix-turn-helix domain-containing protein [Spirochaetia bacterium]|nr:helix-turn-helix domain-containing protein [Spirochaetia bacterium]
MRLGAEFRSSAGLPLVLVDASGREIWKLGACPVCAKLSGSARRRALCRDYRRTAVAESYRWGEPFISLCPFGLVTFAVALSRKRTLSAGLVSGFSIFPQMEADMREEVLARAREHRVRTSLGPRSRLAFRVVTSESLRRSSRLLFDLVAAYGMSDADTVAESREKSAQQFTIAAYLEEARGGKQDLLASLAAMQNEIVDKVVLGDLTGSREIINRFLGVIFLESGMNFDLLKVRLLELIVIISRAAIGKGISAEGLLGPRYSYLTEINAATEFDDLFWKVTKALENFTRAVSRERHRTALAHMTRMKDYLSRHFAGKVTARDVAAAAGLSVSRALHLFRRETGVTLSGWIARLRIDYAIYLMKNTDFSMADIASECGFFDQSHFTKTFRALEGVPPLRYRNGAASPSAQNSRSFTAIPAPTTAQ